MLAHVFLPLLVPAITLGSPARGPDAGVVQDPPVRIWLDNDGRYVPGDEGRVEVRADRDGYLLVLQVDPTGNVRVLFPLDPGDDNFVRGGRKYELVGRGGRRTFYVENSTGTGTIYAAHSLSPFAFEDYVRNGHWDYQVLYLSSIGDIEGATTDLVNRMTSDGRFEYDVARYEVAEEVSYAAAYPAYRIYDPYDTCFSCGRVYYGSGVSFGISIGFGDPWWYDPFYYPTYPPYYGYYPYYAYRAHYWYGYRPYRYHYPRHHYAGNPYRPDYRFKRWWDNSPRGGFDDGYRRRRIGVDVQQVDYRVRSRPDLGPRSRNPVLTSRPDRPADRRTVDRPRGTYEGRRTTSGSPVARPTDRGAGTRRRAEPARPAPTPRADPRRGGDNSNRGRQAKPREETTAKPAPRRTQRPQASPPSRREAQPKPAPSRSQRPGASSPTRREVQPRPAPRSEPRASGRRPARVSRQASPSRTARPQYTPAPRRGAPVLRTPSRVGRGTPSRPRVGRSSPRPSRATRPSVPRPSAGRARPSRQPASRSRRKP